MVWGLGFGVKVWGGLLRIWVLKVEELFGFSYSG